MRRVPITAVLLLMFSAITLTAISLRLPSSNIQSAAGAATAPQILSSAITLRAIGPNGLPLPRANQIYLSDLSYQPVGSYQDDIPTHTFVHLPNTPLMLSAYIEVPGFGNLDFTAANDGAGFIPQGQTIDVLFEVARHRVLSIERLLSTYRSQGLIISTDFDTRLVQAKQKFDQASQTPAGSPRQAQASLESLQTSGPLGEDLVILASKLILEQKGGLNDDQFISTFTRYAGNDNIVYERGKDIFSGAVVFNNWQNYVEFDTGPEHAYHVPLSTLYSDSQYVFPITRITPGIWLNWLPSWVTHNSNGLALITKSITAMHTALAKTLPGAAYWQILSEPHSWDDQGFIGQNDLISIAKKVNSAIKSISGSFQTGVNVALPWGEDAAQNYYRNEPPTKLCQYWNPTIGDHYYSTSCQDNIPGYKLENLTTGYIYQNIHPGTIRLCQYWSSSNQDHSYSTSCQDNIPGYTLENHVTAGYVYPSPQPDTLRLCQYWNKGNKDHSYSTSCQDNIPGYKLEDSITVGYIYQSPQLSPTLPTVVSPYEFLKTALASGLQYDFIVLQLYPSGRDMFEHEQLLQKFHSLGKPIHIELSAPSSNEPMPGYQRTEFCDASGDCRHPSQKYYSWRGGWTENTQAQWMQSMFYLLMSKDYIREFNWWDIKDYADVYLPWSGLIDKNNQPRLSYSTLRALAQEYAPPENISRLPLCQYWNPTSKDHRFNLSCQNNLPRGYQLERQTSAFVYPMPSNNSYVLPLCEYWNKGVTDYAYGYCGNPGLSANYTLNQVAGYTAIPFPALYPPGQISRYCQYWSEGNQDYSYSLSCQNTIPGYQLTEPTNPVYVFSSP